MKIKNFDYKAFSKAVNHEKKARKISLVDMARMLGISPQATSNFLAGQKHIDGVKITMLARAFGLKLHHFENVSPDVYNGFFSWLTADTQESISNKYSARGALSVVMLDCDNNAYIEENYAGFGVFGGVDYFESLAGTNGLKDRAEAVEIYTLSPYKITNTIKFITLSGFENGLTYKKVGNSEICKNRGYLYA